MTESKIIMCQDKGIDWSRKNTKNFNDLHSISSYLAMFTPSLPKFFIEKYTKENDFVLDSFSGRGTTALVCREMKRNFVGSDLNPYAYVLTKFKISTLNIKKIFNRLFELEQEFNNSKYFYCDISLKYKELTYFYSTKTLRQLIFLRERYGYKWLKFNKIDNAIFAIAFGLMHGQMKKDGTTIYFSLSMPNSFSMTPNYVKKYKEKHNLILPDVNVFEKIKDRITNRKGMEILKNTYKSNFKWKDATKPNNSIKNESISLVVTSPPYLTVVNYTSSNWLRLWLLGYDRKTLSNDIELSDKLNFKQYVSFIKSYLNNVHKKIKPFGKVCLVVGDVEGKKLIEDVWKQIRSKVNYELVNIYYDDGYKKEHKVTNYMDKNTGKSTLIEKVLVLEKKCK